jgi:lipopolysaccharide biosynthesis regulator YciM
MSFLDWVRPGFQGNGGDGSLVNYNTNGLQNYLNQFSGQGGGGMVSSPAHHWLPPGVAQQRAYAQQVMQSPQMQQWQQYIQQQLARMNAQPRQPMGNMQDMVERARQQYQQQRLVGGARTGGYTPQY